MVLDAQMLPIEVNLVMMLINQRILAKHIKYMM